ncbi:hypothetical protein [Algoriphagus litoralis]|uniref:hypothetical protein n=1 Tax=Algoriphagus litoralis TaxID=2202829 RepID=UPI000DB9A8E6|nr:hypothetical protein [Algoriphagus litoralis]
MKILSYYLVLTGFLGIITLLITILQSPVILNFIYFFYIIYVLSVSLTTIYFGFNLIGDRAKMGYLGSLVVLFLGIFSFSFQGLKYVMALGFGVILSVIDFDRGIINVSFPVSEFTIQYNSTGSVFGFGVNLVSLLLFIVLFRRYKKM